jgi:GNAT superfamily N-acetyltransferase
LSTETVIRRFEEGDALGVRSLFVAVNRDLAPPEMRVAFEAYVARSLVEEVDRISAYYGDRFWVAIGAGAVVGMFGLEPASPDAMELRRMYVDPAVRRAGLGRLMLGFAEDECRRLGVRRLELSTSELQPAALALYQRAGYRLVRQVVADEASNKTLGGGIRRFHFEKAL